MAGLTAMKPKLRRGLTDHYYAQVLANEPETALKNFPYFGIKEGAMQRYQAAALESEQHAQWALESLVANKELPYAVSAMERIADQYTDMVLAYTSANRLELPQQVHEAIQRAEERMVSQYGQTEPFAPTQPFDAANGVIHHEHRMAAPSAPPPQSVPEPQSYAQMQAMEPPAPAARGDNQSPHITRILDTLSGIIVKPEPQTAHGTRSRQGTIDSSHEINR